MKIVDRQHARAERLRVCFVRFRPLELAVAEDAPNSFQFVRCNLNQHVNLVRERRVIDARTAFAVFGDGGGDFLLRRSENDVASNANSADDERDWLAVISFGPCEILQFRTEDLAVWIEEARDAVDERKRLRAGGDVAATVIGDDGRGNCRYDEACHVSRSAPAMRSRTTASSSLCGRDDAPRHFRFASDRLRTHAQQRKVHSRGTE